MADTPENTQPAQPGVLAVVVAAGVTSYLLDTLRAVAAQEHGPDHVVVVSTVEREVRAVRDVAREAGLPDADVRAAPRARTFGGAVRAVLGQLPDAAAAQPWLWLLHDDSAPHDDALAAQLRVVQQGSSVAVAGAKQTEWHRPDHLVSVGVTTTPTGRRFTGVEDGEIDQGQHDGREDVLAVGTAGMLVRRDVWTALGGPDPELGPFGDGVDLCRRARLAGHRVVVVPGARVRHARASYLGVRERRNGAQADTERRTAPRTPDERRSWEARRRALLHGRLTGVSGPMVVPAFLWMLLVAPVRMLLRVATKEIGLVGAELRAPLAVLARVGPVARSRRRAAVTARVPRRALRPLLVSNTQLWRARRDERLQRAEARRAARAPSELEIAERAAMARRRRGGLAVVLAVAVAVAAVALGSLTFAGALVGGSLLPVDGDVATLWTRATSWWVTSADGYSGPPDPFTVVLAALTTLLGGPLGTPPHVAVTVLVVGSVPLAALGAWFAAGAASRSVPLRSWAALVWAVAPPLLLATSSGRIGALLAHLALPWVALGVARALGVQRRDVVLSGMVGAKRAHADDDEAPTPTAVVPVARPRAGSIGAAAAAGLAFAVACAGAPVLLGVGVLALVVLVIAVGPRRRGRHAGRTRLLLVLAPALALLGPWLTGALVTSGPPDAWRLLVSEPGLPQPVDAGPAWWQLLGWPVEPAAWPGVAAGAGAVVPLVASGTLVLAGLVALLRGSGKIRPVRIGWLVTGIGLVAALVASRTEVGVGTAADGNAQVAYGWAGPGTSVVVLGLLVAAVSAGDGLRGWLTERAFGWRQLTAGVVTVVVVLAPLATAAAWVWSVRAEESPGSPALAVEPRGADPVPALGRQLQESTAGARVLAISTDDAGLRVQLWRDNGPQLLDATSPVTARAVSGAPREGVPAAPDAADTALAGLAALLAASSDAAADELAAHAVGVVVVPPLDSRVAPGHDTTARARLVASLDATAGLERVTENASGVVWRVAADVGSSRARIVTPGDDGAAVVAAGLVRAGGHLPAASVERIVVLAERADDGWRATIGSAELEATADGWEQGFTVPAGLGGELRVTYDSPWRVPWGVAVVTVLALSALLALPTRRRRESD
ncbi:glycosyl transferase domain-containing protein [Beutenbergia cavernae DSM 12333]|uniref:Glycosyl transferase domain-containing protein n=1 Tax=Beutenbergia cavernae (strain ATCC BAA-8 / DSM 12333 / CCUG 43141 / JCM 11478 / NBRC 16432 / NCIMB 13614 / HKI 0122) TaxID=471853 RepID=C5C163_BEUC1|nr:glycosyltransferase [Beutenbergia cavernae]ACQ79467.1 glycosyl transferase domain-containing protein [Beutenbergia cavernae DSM 12333]